MEAIVADTVYKTLDAKTLRVFERCTDNPDDLIKHLAVVDTMVAIYIANSIKLGLEDEKVLEEIIYSLIGVPKCYREEKESMRYIG